MEKLHFTILNFDLFFNVLSKLLIWIIYLPIGLNCTLVTPFIQIAVRMDGKVNNVPNTWHTGPPGQLLPTIPFENPKIPSSLLTLTPNTFFLFLLSLCPDLHPQNFPSSSSKLHGQSISSYQPLLIIKKFQCFKN